MGIMQIFVCLLHSYQGMYYESNWKKKKKENVFSYVLACGQTAAKCTAALKTK